MKFIQLYDTKGAKVYLNVQFIKDFKETSMLAVSTGENKVYIHDVANCKYYYIDGIEKFCEYIHMEEI